MLFCRFFHRRRGCTHLLVKKDVLYLSQSPSCTQGIDHLSDHRLYFDTVDRFLDIEFNPAFVSTCDHILGCNLRKHDIGTIRKNIAGFFDERDTIYFRHQKVDYDNVGLGRKQIIQSVGSTLGGSAYFAELPAFDNQFQNIQNIAVIID